MASLGGEPMDNAIKQAHEMCVLQMAELTQCMKQANTNATECFTNVFEYGD